MKKAIRINKPAEPTLDDVRLQYLDKLKSQSVHQTVSELHRKMGELEVQTFEGGFQAERLERLEFYRKLARELYTHELVQASKHFYKKD